MNTACPTYVHVSSSRLRWKNRFVLALRIRQWQYLFIGHVRCSNDELLHFGRSGRQRSDGDPISSDGWRLVRHRSVDSRCFRCAIVRYLSDLFLLDLLTLISLSSCLNFHVRSFCRFAVYLCNTHPFDDATEVLLVQFTLSLSLRHRRRRDRCSCLVM